MNSGICVFAQLLQFVNKYVFDQIVKSTMVIIEFENLIVGINLLSCFLDNLITLTFYEIFVYALKPTITSCIIWESRVMSAIQPYHEQTKNVIGKFLLILDII